MRQEASAWALIIPIWGKCWMEFCGHLIPNSEGHLLWPIHRTTIRYDQFDFYAFDFNRVMIIFRNPTKWWAARGNRRLIFSVRVWQRCPVWFLTEWAAWNSLSFFRESHCTWTKNCERWPSSACRISLSISLFGEKMSSTVVDVDNLVRSVTYEFYCRVHSVYNQRSSRYSSAIARQCFAHSAPAFDNLEKYRDYGVA